jgi:hypothetical protein
MGIFELSELRISYTFGIYCPAWLSLEFHPGHGSPASVRQAEGPSDDDTEARTDEDRRIAELT